jgi:hypothetical protein
MINVKYAETLSPKCFLYIFEAYYNAVIFIKKLYMTIPKEWDEAYKIKPNMNQ